MLLSVLPASTGDSLIVKWKGNSGLHRNLLIDGGMSSSYKHALRREIESILVNKQKIDLLILTHTDSDHIGGLLRLLAEMQLENFPRNLIAYCWFNSAGVLSKYFHTKPEKDKEIFIPYIGKDLSANQAHTLESYLDQVSTLTNTLPIQNRLTENIDGLEIEVLSPRETDLIKLLNNWKIENLDKGPVQISRAKYDYSESICELVSRDFIEDTGIPNGSSITTLVEYDSKKILLLADSHPSQIVLALSERGYTVANRLELDCVKVSHHGSRHNTSDQLLDLITCSRFAISTNGNNIHALPHKEALSRIVKHNHSRGISTELIFNYQTPSEQIFSEQEMREFNFNCLYQNNINLSL